MSSPTQTTPPNCRACGRALAPSAAFCRSCGVPVRPEPPPADGVPEEKRGKTLRVVLLAALAAVLVGLSVGAAVMLFGERGSEADNSAATTQATVPSTESPPTQTGAATSSSPGPEAPEQRAVGAVEAGRYVQAGSFRTVAGVEAEQRRLANAGVYVSVVDSDGAQDLLPGFQVLLGGPFSTSAQESRMLERVREEGVPSAFARDLTPARAISGPSEAAGEWVGDLERTGTVRSGLNGNLRATLDAAPDGVTASLVFDDLGCEAVLSIVEVTEFTLAYEQRGPSCVGEGRWSLRPSGSEISATLLPPNTDVVVVGTLRRR